MRVWIFATVIIAACGSDEATGPDAAGVPDAAGGADAAPCANPLDQPTLDALTHSFWAAPVIELRPGDQRDLELGTVELGGAFQAVAVCATWSIAPTTGATIDPATGVIEVDAATASGTTFVVTADVESGRKLITADVIVYTAAAMPWHGAWRENVEYTCATGAEVAPEQVINEIYFWADGTLWVTWTPFEVYVDYWASYAFDTGASTLRIKPEGGNYVPADIDASGTFVFAGGALQLHDMYLGSPQSGTGPVRCGHELIR